MLATSLLLAALAGSAGPEPPAAAPAADGTFEIVVVQQHHPNAPRDVVRVEADAMEIVHWGSVVLRRAGDAVAAFNVHQVVIVADRTAAGAETFEVMLVTGETLTIRADRMEPSQNNLVAFYTGDRLVGLAGQNQVRLIVAQSARVAGAAREADRRDGTLR